MLSLILDLFCFRFHCKHILAAEASIPELTEKAIIAGIENDRQYCAGNEINQRWLRHLHHNNGKKRNYEPIEIT